MEDKNTPLFSPPPVLPPLPPPPLSSPQSSLSIPTTITNHFSFFNDTFFEKPLSDLLNVEDFGPSLDEWLGIAEEDAMLAERLIKHPLPSLPQGTVVLESSEAIAQSQNPTLSVISSNPDVVIANNNTNNKIAGLKRSAESIVDDGGNGNLRGNEPDKEKNNIITRLKLRASTVASIAAAMSMDNKRNKNNLSKFVLLTESESENLEDGYKWRKYGKKSVRNSPFQRSYYRCTAIGCNAKKRVERCVDNPTHVVTTYEGLHTHDLPPILPPPPSRPFSLDNNSTLNPKLGGGGGKQQGEVSDVGAGAKAKNHANNTIISVNVRTECGSGVNDVSLQGTVTAPNEFNYNQQMQNVQQAITPTILQYFNSSALQTSLNNVIPIIIADNNHCPSSSISVHRDNNHHGDVFNGRSLNNDSYATSSTDGGEDLFKKKIIGTGMLEDIVNFSSTTSRGHHHQPTFL